MTPSRMQADALINELIKTATTERDRILESAKEDSTELLQRTHRNARKRMRAAILALRNRSETELRRAEAELATAKRYRRHAEETEALAEAWTQLETTMADRWQDPEGRRQWVASTVADAGKSLHPGAWSIEHPADWNAYEHSDQIDDLTEIAGTRPSLTADATIAAGLRIIAANAILDSSLTRLLANRPLIEALLLAELEGEGPDD